MKCKKRFRNSKLSLENNVDTLVLLLVPDNTGDIEVLKTKRFWENQASFVFLVETDHFRAKNICKITPKCSL